MTERGRGYNNPSSGCKRTHRLTPKRSFAIRTHQPTGPATARRDRIERPHLKTNRLLDYLTVDNLTTQIGYGPGQWGLYLVKELLDNALDAAEEHGVSPQVEVRVDGEGITVMDNGGGIPPSVVVDVLDFNSRVSSRAHHVAPSRGQQGNALKTALAIPYVLDALKGRRNPLGRVDIEAHGVRTEIAIKADLIEQKPVPECTQVAGFVQNGSIVRIHWPESACSELQASKARFVQMAQGYALLNPHLTIKLDCFGHPYQIEAIDPKWKKWTPSDPASIHWYDLPRFERHIAAEISADRERSEERTIRAFVAQFRGLTRSGGAQAEVLQRTGLATVKLAALARGRDLDHEAAAKLLRIMKDATAPVEPKALGMVGRKQMCARLEQLGCEPKLIRYKGCARRMPDGLPWFMEVGFGWRETARARRLIAGINWSPSIRNPFADVAHDEVPFSEFLEDCRLGEREPVIVVVHYVCPRVEFRDRGKSAIVFDDAPTYMDTKEKEIA